MQERATKFIEVLESEALLSPDILDELRKQVAESKTKLKPELLAKLLVDNGHLTKFQATKLIAGMSENDDANADNADASANDDLTFAESEANSSGNVVAAEEVETVPVVESVESVDSVEVIQTVESVQAVPVVTEDEPAELLGAKISAAAQAEDEIRPLSANPKVVRKPPPANDNPWDSSRILVRGVGLAMLVVALTALVYWFSRGSADDALAKAESSYEQRSYEDAAAAYEKFAQSWPTHEKASFAKVRQVLATIRKATESVPNPSVGLKTVMDNLPGIAEEPALTGERSDLTGVLVSLAAKFVDRADSGKATAERKELMGELGTLLGLINDPKYVGQAEQNQQRVMLDKIFEAEKRINYEIGRDERLALTLGEMDKLLDEKKPEEAFGKRDELTDTYPV